MLGSIHFLFSAGSRSSPRSTSYDVRGVVRRLSSLCQHVCVRSMRRAMGTVRIHLSSLHAGSCMVSPSRMRSASTRATTCWLEPPSRSVPIATIGAAMEQRPAPIVYTGYGMAAKPSNSGSRSGDRGRPEGADGVEYSTSSMHFVVASA